jgi:hypothetical protein
LHIPYTEVCRSLAANTRQGAGLSYHRSGTSPPRQTAVGTVALGLTACRHDHDLHPPVLGPPLCGVVDATGLESPKPCADRMFGFTPCATRYRTTPVARAVESSQFEGNRFRSAGPMGRLSVNPSTTIRWFRRLVSVGMILLSVASPSATSWLRFTPGSPKALTRLICRRPGRCLPR